MLQELQEILRMLENIQKDLTLGDKHYFAKSHIVKLKWEVEEVLSEVRRREDSE